MSVCAEWAFQSVKPGGTAGKIKVYLFKIQVFIDLVPAVCLGQDFFIIKLHNPDPDFKKCKGDKTMKEKQTIPYKIYLTEEELPTQYYDVRADMKQKPAPLLNPATHKPMTPEELEAVFCKELVEQELNVSNAYVDIPAEIRDFYKMYRPAPLVRAYCLEKELDTPAKIYYKFEGNNTSGSHKLNSAIAQAYYAKKQGLKGVTTETGAGQWGLRDRKSVV